MSGTSIIAKISMSLSRYAHEGMKDISNVKLQWKCKYSNPRSIMQQEICEAFNFIQLAA